jgi:hypothetical protein
MVDCRPCETPIDLKYRLENDEERATTDKGQYQRLVGKVIYLAHTRPNIAYAVSVVSQFMHNPKDSHLQVVYRLLRYLKSTPGK